MAGPAGESCKAIQLVAVLLLLFVVHPTASMPNCSVKDGKTGKLRLSEMGYGYFRTNLEMVQMKVHTKYRYTTECRRLSNRWFNELPRPVSPLLHINVSDLTPTSVARLGLNKEPWYEINFIICDKILLRIGSRVTELVLSRDKSCHPEYLELYIKGAKILCPSKMKYTEVKSKCPEVSTPSLDATNSSSTPSPTENISDIFSSQNDQILNFFDNGDVDSDIMNIQGLYDHHPSLATITLPTINRMEDSYIYKGIEYQSRREESAIPIFIGVMAFTLSMCMRFCLCRGKNVVQRVTTVTVIRSRPAPEALEENQHDPALDPPPAYVDVVNETPTPQATQELPPAYSDIDPPPYLEIATPDDKLPESTAGSERQDSSGQSSTDAPPDDEVSQESSGAVTSSFARALSKARTQQKQFSFKPLEEDD